MAVKTFTVSQVKIAGNKVANVENAALAITINTGETTGLGDTWRSLVTLGKQATLTMTYSQNTTDTAQNVLASEWITGDCVPGTVQMYYDTSHYFTCATMFITGWSETEAVGAANKISVTLESNTSVSKT